MGITVGGLIFIAGVLILGFLLYYPIRDWLYGAQEGFEHNARSAVEVLPASYSPPKTVASSGPSAPAQEAPKGEVVIHAEPAPRDPEAEDEEASNAAPKITYPERHYRPSPPNDQVGLAYESGVAGPSAQNSPQAYQKFGLDTVQNSGEFYGGVYANDTTSDMNFSSF